MAQAPDLFRKALLLDSVGAKGVVLNEEIEQAFEQMAEDKQLTGAVIGGTIYQLDPEDSFFNKVIIEDAYKAVKNLGKSVLFYKI